MSNITKSLDLFWKKAVKPIKESIVAQSVAVPSTLPATGWTEDKDDKTGFPYRYDLEAEGITENDVVSVVVSPSGLAAAALCGLCPVNETLAGKIRFWAASAPSTSIQILYWLTSQMKTNIEGGTE